MKIQGVVGDVGAGHETQYEWRWGSRADAEFGEKAVSEFVARFHARFHSDIQTYAPHAYDATMTVAAAMRQAGSTDPVKFLPVLRQIQHPGLTGTIRFDANGDIRDGALTVSTYRAGKKIKLIVLR